MNKMDEKILVIDRYYLFENEALAFQGLLTDSNSVKHIMKKFNAYEEIRRGDAETDETFKQPIPYAIITRGDEVFVYKRLGGGGETRLHEQLSIGVGGHMNRINDVNNWEFNLWVNLHRELTEELQFDWGTWEGAIPEPKILGLINDDENEVGRVHIGILAVVDLPIYTEVTVRETEQLEGYWIRIKDLEKEPLFSSLETWSQIAAGVLLG